MEWDETVPMSIHATTQHACRVVQVSLVQDWRRTLVSQGHNSHLLNRNTSQVVYLQQMNYHLALIAQDIEDSPYIFHKEEHGNYLDHVFICFLCIMDFPGNISPNDENNNCNILKRKLYFVPQNSL